MAELLAVTITEQLEKAGWIVLPRHRFYLHDCLFK
jgi:hypothetical protein